MHDRLRCDHTPAWSALRALQAAGYRPGVISRGYGRTTESPPVTEVRPDSPAPQAGDAPLLLRLR